MPVGTFRFYGPLNDFLPPARRQASFEHAWEGRVSVKDVVEALGVPHPEIDLLLANDRPIGFGYHLEDGDRVAAYPPMHAIEVHAISLVRPPVLDEPRFVLDVHLGRLAAYLRLAGFDTLYENDYADETLAAISSGERRILLTRDAALLKRAAVTYGYFLRETNPRRQLAEVVARFDLAPLARPFARCLRCNTPIEAAAKADVLPQLPPRVRAGYDRFWRCPGCDRVYWRGSHYQWMVRLVEEVRMNVPGSPNGPGEDGPAGS